MCDLILMSEERTIGNPLKQIHNHENDLSQNQVIQMWQIDSINQINVVLL